MKLHQFYKRFENTPKDERFRPVNMTPEITSLFVIFKRLGDVRAQKRYFESQEAHLLAQAEIIYKNNKK